MRMKPVVVLLATIGVCLPAAVGAIRLTETRHERFSVGAGPRFELENVDGNVWIETGAEGGIDVRAEIRVKATSKRMLRSLFEGVRIETSQEGNAVRVKTLLPRVYLTGFPGLSQKEHPAIRVRYFVTVPRGTSLALRTVNGDIEIEAPPGALGPVEAHASHGKVLTK